MKKHTRSILAELNNIGMKKDNDLLIETTASNIIESSINLLNRINDIYDAETAGELERKFINSIKSGDTKKFKRSMGRIIESKKNGNS
jgi:hypothetical protein